jgi:hypothetical protein
MPVNVRASIKVADEVWIVTALLHRERPDRPDFSIDEIVDRAAREHLTADLRPGVYVHVVQHCVANRPPNPGRYRMLFETAPDRRRLFRVGDPYNAAREGSKIVPEVDDLPHGYNGLLTWYHDWEAARTAGAEADDSLLALRGTGKGLWADEHADEYVRRLREGWE